MAARFVDVPADAIRARLGGAGFYRAQVAGREEVWERKHDRDPTYLIRVYTSIAHGEGTRACGADAIRVIALLAPSNGKVYPIHKGVRVHRAGSVDGVLDRVIERAREAYAACNAHRRKMAAR